MAILIFAVVMALIAFMLCYVVDAAQIQPPASNIAKMAIIFVAVLVILNRAGLI